MKLTEKDVGCCFKTRGGSVVKGLAITNVHFATVDDFGYIETHDLKGVCIDCDDLGDRYSNMDLISRVDDRYWLHEMPDAELFDCASIAYTGKEWVWSKLDRMFLLEGEWMNSCGVFSGMKLPDISVCKEDLHKTFITIKDLREFQKGVGKTTYICKDNDTL